MSDKRKFERLPARLEVEIRTRGRGQVCPSVNVSRHGMFLATPNPPNERQLLILRIPIPDGQAPIDVMAQVVRRVADAEAGERNMPTGMGINFFALTEENKGRWELYLSKLRGHTPPAAILPEHATRPTFLLQPKDVERLRLFASREFALGTMFLRTPVLRKVGETLRVILLHPVSDEEFSILSTVRTLHEGNETEPKGMTLDFAPHSPETRVALEAFVEHGTPPPEDAPTSPAEVATPSETQPKPPIRPPPLPKHAQTASVAAVSSEAPPAEEPISDELAEAAASAGVDEALLRPREEKPLPSGDEPAPAPKATEPLPMDERPLSAEGSAEGGTEHELDSEISFGPSPDDASPPAGPAPKAFDPEPAASAQAVPSPPPIDEAQDEAPKEAAEPPDPTLPELRRLVEAGPEDVGALFRLASALAQRAATAEEAVGLMQKLQTLEPHHPLANGVLALAYAQLGQRPSAERHVTRARRLGQPVDPRVHELLARV